jgi:hypothetical protein
MPRSAACWGGDRALCPPVAAVVGGSGHAADAVPAAAAAAGAPAPAAAVAVANAPRAAAAGGAAAVAKTAGAYVPW